MGTAADIKSCQIALTMRGELRIEDPAAPGTTAAFIVQRVAPGLGNIQCSRNKSLQLRRKAYPIDPATSGQLTQRAKLAAAVAAWRAISPEEREAWNNTPNRRHLPGYHLFLSNWMR